METRRSNSGESDLGVDLDGEDLAGVEDGAALDGVEDGAAGDGKRSESETSGQIHDTSFAKKALID